MVSSTSSRLALESMETMSLRGTMISRTTTVPRSSTRWIMSSCDLRQVSEAAAGADDELQFLRRVAARVGAAALIFSARIRASGGALDDHHERDGDPVEHEQGGRDQHSDAVGLGDREILRQHLAHHHVEVADDQERENEAQRRAGSFAVTGVVMGLKQRDQQMIEVSSPAHPKPEARERDANLGDREQASGIGQEVERGLRAGVPFFRQLPQPGVPHRKQRNLGAREVPVDRDQQDDQQNAKWRIGHAHAQSGAGAMPAPQKF